MIMCVCITLYNLLIIIILLPALKLLINLAHINTSEKVHLLLICVLIKLLILAKIHIKIRDSNCYINYEYTLHVKEQ